MADDVKSRIAELEKELYSKEFKPREIGDVLTHKEAPVASSWGEAAQTTLSPDEAEKIEKRHRMMKKFALSSGGFFVIAILIAGFIWWKGTNVISGDNIILDPVAPPAVAGGELFETKFLITNNNKVSVDAATLLIEYPVGFYSGSDRAELPRVVKDLGSISPGQAITESINTLLYGEENTTKDIMVTLEYRIAGSNATLKKTTTYSIKISSSPINIKLGLPKEASSGREVELAVDINSNSKDPIGALVVEATYPFGFTFKGADPAPSYGTNSWQISGLAPQEMRTIKIRGIIEGQENEEKITKISIGTKNPKDERFIGVVYNAVTETTRITKPFLGIDVAVDGSRANDHVGVLGRGVRVDVFWQNNNPTPVTDAVLEVQLKGDVLNRYSIYASNGGFYRSIDDTIVWDRTVNQDFRNLDPGAKGAVSFSFSPRPVDVTTSSTIRNPQVSFEVRARARRVSGAGAAEDVVTFSSRTVKFETDLRLAAKGTYFVGPFKNSGPLPPRADKETTYTVSFTVRNSSNNVSNAMVKTTLPLYVKWLGRISPEGEGITYNDTTSEVSWNVGRIPSGGAREASFQISFLPSLSQINQSPKLTGDMFLTGMDDFTKTEIRDQKAAITTYLSSDPQFGQNQANVVN